MRLDELFPPERLRGMAESVRKFAAQFGIEDFRQPERVPNTRRALALAEVARDEARLEPYRYRAMDAHWRDGMNLESDDDLRTIAREAGLSEDAVERSVSDPQYFDRIDEIREEAGRIGVEGIPAFIIGNLGLAGCQPFEVLAEFATKAGAKRKFVADRT